MDSLARKLETVPNMSKKDLELSLEYISDQIRRIEQKLTIRIEREIEEEFENNRRTILEIESLLKNEESACN